MVRYRSNGRGCWAERVCDGRGCGGRYAVGAPPPAAATSRVSASGGWWRGSIFSAAGWALGVLKSCRSRVAAIAPRGAGLPVQIVHCAHPCSKSISTPSTTRQPASSACETRAVLGLGLGLGFGLGLGLGLGFASSACETKAVCRGM